jgi:hypothetical protein
VQGLMPVVVRHFLSRRDPTWCLGRWLLTSHVIWAISFNRMRRAVSYTLLGAIPCQPGSKDTGNPGKMSLQFCLGECAANKVSRIMCILSFQDADVFLL